MKKLTFIIIAIIIAIVFGIAGYMIGINSDKSSNVVGIYHSNSWNGQEATLVLNEDGTCKYPTGNTGIWTKENDVIHIDLGDTLKIHDAMIVKDGVILYDVMFQKMSK